MTVVFKSGLFCIIMLMLSGPGLGQADSGKINRDLKPEVYKINYRVEVPVTVVAIGVNLLNFYGMSKKPNSTEEQIKSLDKSNIPFFDRWTVHAYSKS